MNAGESLQISLPSQMKNYVRVWAASVSTSILFYAGLVLAGMDKNWAIVFSLLFLVTVQLYGERRQYTRFREDSDFLKALSHEIPSLLEDLSVLTRRVSERCEWETQRLDALAAARTELYREREELLIQEQSKGFGRRMKRILQEKNREIARVVKEENSTREAIDDLSAFLLEIDAQMAELCNLQEHSTAVIIEMVVKLRSDLVSSLRGLVEELKKQQGEIYKKGTLVTHRSAYGELVPAV
jgi:hypothetical protein